MESILSLPKNCMVFLRIIPVKKVDEVHRIVYNTESAEKISVTVHTGVYSNEKSAAHRSVGAVMKRLLIVRQRRSII